MAAQQHPSERIWRTSFVCRKENWGRAHSYDIPNPSEHFYRLTEIAARIQVLSGADTQISLTVTHTTAPSFRGRELVSSKADQVSHHNDRK